MLLLSGQFFLPRYTAHELEKSLADEITAYQELTVEVATFPALELLWGRADRIEVRGREILVDRLELDTLRAEFSDLKLVERKGEWEVVEGVNESLYLLLSEESLNDYLATKEELALFKRFKLDLTPQQVILKGVLSLFNAEVTLQLTGNFKLIEDEEIIFVSDQLAVENFLVSTSSVEQLKDKLQFSLDLSNLALPLEVRKIKLKSDCLEILGPKEENN